MESSFSRRVMFGIAATVGIWLTSCSDSFATLDPALEPAGASVSRGQNPDTLRWGWDGVEPATGGPSCEETLAAPSPECCYVKPWLPGCMPVPCHPDQDALAEEYENPIYQNTLRPNCWDFTSDGGSTNFSWSELNGGWQTGNPHPYWGMIHGNLMQGLEATRTIYNRGGILLTSGYRCPHGNKNINGVLNSNHTHGRAADMYSADHGGRNWSLAECALLRDAAASTSPGPVELLPCDRYEDLHLHAAW